MTEPSLSFTAEQPHTNLSCTNRRNGSPLDPAGRSNNLYSGDFGLCKGEFFPEGLFFNWVQVTVDSRRYTTERSPQWLHSCYGFVPDKGSCTVLFDALVEAMACSAAKSFLDDTGFIPEPGSFEAYVRCLFEGGLVEEGFNVYLRLKEAGVSASIKTCKSGFRGCLMAGRTDILWQLYQEMVASGIVADVDAETVGYLIQACCCNDELLKGYELLRQVLEDGLDPGNVAFNKLISGFCKKNNLTAVSELLHTMIARNCYPDIFSYQEVINGLCKKRKRLEALCVFNDLKDRGYAPNRVMYTTMIHGLCEMGCFGDARKLWFEMITKGITPNEYTYNALIHGFFKMGNFLEACKLHKEMCNQGFGETTVSYNTMISGFCLHGKTKVAYGLFEEMSKKGIVRDVKTYNYLIKCFCKEGKIEESQKLFEELLAQGLRPSTFSYTPLIRYLCQVGDLQEAKRLLQDMQNRDLQPSVYTYDHIVIGFYEQGNVTEGMEWLIEMLKRKLKPQKKTFEKLVGCLSQSDKLDDTLLVLDFMFRNGYALRPGLCHHLVTRLCKENPNFVERVLELLHYSLEIACSIQQAATMEPNLRLGSLKVPPASLLVFPVLFIMILAPIYDHPIIPFAWRVTKSEMGVSHLQRIGIGLVLSMITMALAALVEIKRKRVATNTRTT
ncbi:pentatricopeptide repeat-containing protein [Tripterygium wilfordii]|uniref:Pentatricopeptide repeat-containing protein n=1 Tax=Tripterygium wilfordii TaxID=458696 RepID=A0A7J7E0Z8_TRIWF|nr:pentatricopeptide repeat-containing protein [Tripterygium wilfordii]